MNEQPRNQEFYSEDAMVTSDIDHEAAVAAEVNAPMTQLYKAGHTILVPDADVDSFLAEGWTRENTDPHSAAGELRTLADALVVAFDDLLAEAEQHGELDPTKAVAVAQAAFVALGEMASNVLQAIQLRYPMTQGEGVLLGRLGPNGEDEETHVDPGQVVDYTALGWVVKGGA